MSRYKTEHKIVDVSPIPVFSIFAKEAVIRDSETGEEARGYDWQSFEKAERQAWERLRAHS